MPESRKPCWPATDTHRKCICPDKVRIYSVDGRRRLLIPCGRRVCRHCGPWHWRPRVQAGLHSGLRAAPQESYLAILLTAPGDIDADEFNADSSRRWHHFVTILRRRFPGVDLQYWRVAELQERGHVHFHFVLRGLRYLPLADGPKGPGLRTLAITAGFGPWVGLKRPRDYPGGVRSLGWYFSKYMLKQYARRIGVVKIVTMSQGWRVGWEDRRKASTGQWVYGGAVGRGWGVLGHVVRPSRADAPVVEPWRPSWWRHHWTVYRKREAASLMVWRT